MNLHKCVYLRADSDFSESSSELCPRDSVAALGGVDRYVETARHGHSVIGRVTRHGVVWFAKWLDESHSDLAESRLRLRKEYQILLRLNHPGVVRAAGLEENPQTGLALRMELAEGEMLGDFLQHATRAQRSAAAMRLLEGGSLYPFKRCVSSRPETRECDGVGQRRRHPCENHRLRNERLRRGSDVQNRRRQPPLRCARAVPARLQMRPQGGCLKSRNAHKRDASRPDIAASGAESPDRDNFLPGTADPPHNPALEAEYAAIVKTLLNELKLPTDSLATLAADESLPRNVRASRMSVAIYGMNRRIASAFDSLRQHCPEDFLSRQKPGWATIFDPALSSHRDRVERILHDFSTPTDSI